MPNTTSAACVPVRVKMRLQAIGLWAFLSIPSIVVTILLFVWTIDGEKVRSFRLTICGAASNQLYRFVVLLP